MSPDLALTFGERHRITALVVLGAATLTAILLRLATYDYGNESSLFHPHGYCYLWLPSLVALHVVSDTLIGLSYVAISVTLVYLVWKTRRGPLNAVLGWADVLERRRDPELMKRALPVIKRNALAQARVVGDLLDLSSITAGQLRIELRPTDLRPVVENAVDAVRPAAEAKHLWIEVRDGRTGRNRPRGRGAPAAGRLEPPVERGEVHT